MERFSVLLAVYAGDSPSFLEACLESIFAQTLRPNELVIVEDGAISQEMKAVINSFLSEELRIKSVVLKQNSGLAIALNRGLAKCSYELVARMDADDICVPDRFAEQIAFMSENPEVHVLGTWVEEFDADMRKSLGIRKTPLTSDEVYRFAKRRSPLNHPTVMFRKSAVLAVGGYPEFRKAQDYALWSLMLSKGYIMRNLAQVSVKMRAGDGLLARRGHAYLKHELNILVFQRKIGFLSNFEFSSNYLARSLVRLSPDFVKSLIYKFAR